MHVNIVLGLVSCYFSQLQHGLFKCYADYAYNQIRKAFTTAKIVKRKL